MNRRLLKNNVRKITLMVFIIFFCTVNSALSQDDIINHVKDNKYPLNQADQLEFLTKPEESIIEVGLPYSYSLSVSDSIETLTEISLISDHQWLTLTHVNLSKGTALLEGTPQINNIGTHLIKIQAKTMNHIASQSFMLTVPVLFDSFENDNSDWFIVKEDQYVNEWTFGDLISKTGSMSAYTTKPALNYNESILERSIDLTHITGGWINFFWSCGACCVYDEGLLANYGQLIIRDSNGDIYIHDLFGQANWQNEAFDLSQYSGQMINVQFKWVKNLYYTPDKYGISIDDILITGKSTQKPIFINEPKNQVMVGQTYSYSVQLNNSIDLTIKKIKLPEWLKLNTELSTNNVILTGTPEYSDMKIHSVIIEAENSAGSTVLSYSLEVMYFLDDFEQDFPNRLTTGEEPYTFNFWAIGDIDKHEPDKLAYITYDKEGKHSYFNPYKKSSALLTYSMDFSHLLSPQLTFNWKCLSSYYSKDIYYGYGEVYVSDMDGTLTRVSETAEFEDNNKWSVKTIDLSDYQGKSISLIFKWINDSYGAGLMNGLMVDDIEIRGTYSDYPIIDTPIFVSNPDINGYTIYAGDTYQYSIITKDFNNDDVEISCEICPPDWFKIVNMEPDKGTALLIGEPSYYSTVDIVIKASDGQNTERQEFKLYVLERNPYRSGQKWPVNEIVWCFKKIQDVAINSKNQVFVTDIKTHQIFKYFAYGQKSHHWGGYGEDVGKFNCPSDIAIDLQDNVFVLDANNYRVQKFDCNGNFLAKFEINEQIGNFSYKAISIDKQGSIYIAEDMYGIIFKFDSKGVFLRNWEIKNIDANLHNIQDIAVDNDGYVYVCDSLNELTINHNIQKYDSDGNFILSFGKFGTGDGEFNVPRGLLYMVHLFSLLINITHEFSNLIVMEYL